MVGNWKMNQNLADLDSFFAEIKNSKLVGGNFWIAPQAIHIASSLCYCDKSEFKIGAQNCSEHDFGAYTGEISATSLKDLGAYFVILGHSERRAIFGESDKVINSKVKKVLAAQLIPILCVGETLEQRESGQTMDVVLGQLKAGLKDVKLAGASDMIVAYEPVWAIGTGKTASPVQAEEVHAQIRKLLCELYTDDLGKEISLLYGGSVKPENVVELLSQPNINGGLVGGASLKASDFSKLCQATL